MQPDDPSSRNAELLAVRSLLDELVEKKIGGADPDSETALEAHSDAAIAFSAIQDLIRIAADARATPAGPPLELGDSDDVDPPNTMSIPLPPRPLLAYGRPAQLIDFQAAQLLDLLDTQIDQMREVSSIISANSAPSRSVAPHGRVPISPISAPHAASPRARPSTPALATQTSSTLSPTLPPLRPTSASSNSAPQGGTAGPQPPPTASTAAADARSHSNALKAASAAIADFLAQHRTTAQRARAARELSEYSQEGRTVFDTRYTDAVLDALRYPHCDDAYGGKSVSHDTAVTAAVAVGKEGVQKEGGGVDVDAVIRGAEDTNVWKCVLRSSVKGRGSVAWVVSASDGLAVAEQSHAYGLQCTILSVGYITHLVHALLKKGGVANTSDPAVDDIQGAPSGEFAGALAGSMVYTPEAVDKSFDGDGLLPPAMDMRESQSGSFAEGGGVEGAVGGAEEGVRGLRVTARRARGAGKFAIYVFDVPPPPYAFAGYCPGVVPAGEHLSMLGAAYAADSVVTTAVGGSDGRAVSSIEASVGVGGTTSLPLQPAEAASFAARVHEAVDIAHPFTLTGYTSWADGGRGSATLYDAALKAAMHAYSQSNTMPPGVIRWMKRHLGGPRGGPVGTMCAVRSRMVVVRSTARATARPPVSGSGGGSGGGRPTPVCLPSALFGDVFGYYCTEDVAHILSPPTDEDPMVADARRSSSPPPSPRAAGGVVWRSRRRSLVPVVRSTQASLPEASVGTTPMEPPLPSTALEGGVQRAAHAVAVTYGEVPAPTTGMWQVSRSAVSVTPPLFGDYACPVAPSLVRDGVVGPWIALQFTSAAVVPCAYSLASVHPIHCGHHLRSWEVQASTDGHDWVCIDARTNDTRLTDESPLCLFPTSPLPTTGREPLQIGPFSHFRLVMLSPNSSGTWQLQLSGFELYGRVVTTRPPPAPLRATAPPRPIPRDDAFFDDVPMPREQVQTTTASTAATAKKGRGGGGRGGGRGTTRPSTRR